MLKCRLRGCSCGSRSGEPISWVIRILVGWGTITMTNGASERIRCKGSYAVNGTGKAVQQNLRCASASYRLEISSNVTSEGGVLSGYWSEATRSVSGNVSGRASGTEIVANVMGAGFTARLDVRTHGDKQSVTIRPQGGDRDVAAVSIALRKGTTEKWSS